MSHYTDEVIINKLNEILTLLKKDYESQLAQQKAMLDEVLKDALEIFKTYDPYEEVNAFQEKYKDLIAKVKEK